MADVPSFWDYFTNAAGWIRKLLSDGEQRARSASLWRGFLNDGRATFVLASGFILATAVTIRATALAVTGYLDNLHRNTDDLLLAEHEPRRGDRQFGVLGALLAKITRDGQVISFDPCAATAPRTSPAASATAMASVTAAASGSPAASSTAGARGVPDCQRLSDFIDESVRLWNRRLELQPGNALPVLQPSGADLATNEDALIDFLQRYQKKCVDEPRSKGVVERPAPVTIGPPTSADPSLEENCSELEKRLNAIVGPITCEPTAGASGVRSRYRGCDRFDIERQRRSRLSVVEQEDDGGATHPSYSKEVLNEVADSLLFEIAFAKEMELVKGTSDQAGDGPDETSRLVSLYFIGEHDVLRLWTAGSESHPAKQQFTPTRRWTPARYFEDLQKDPKLDYFVSAPYIDYAGMGLVRTFCKPLRDAERLRGVICGDMSLPLRDLEESLKKNLLVEHWFVRAEVPFTGNSVTVSSRYNFKEETKGPLRDEVAARLLREAEAQHLTSSSALDELGRTILPIVVAGSPGKEELQNGEDPLYDLLANPARSADRVPEEPLRLPKKEVVLSGGTQRMWLVPIGRHGGSLYAILLRARRGPTESIWGLVLAMLVSVLGTGLFTAALLRRSQRHAVRERVQTMLRNLQTGVVQIDEEDNIIEANDRAEELLGVPLPRFGDETGTEYQTPFPGLIDPWVVEAPPDGPMKVGRYEHVIPPKRQGGVPSAYFARLSAGRRAGSWLRILGSPMFFVNVSGTAMSRYPKTYGVLEPARDEELRKIRQLHRDATSALFTLSDTLGIEPLNEAGRRLLERGTSRDHLGTLLLNDLLSPRVVPLQRVDDPEMEAEIDVGRTVLLADRISSGDSFAALTMPALEAEGANEPRQAWIRVRVLGAEETVTLSRFVRSGQRLLCAEILEADSDLAKKLEEQFGQQMKAITKGIDP